MRAMLTFGSLLIVLAVVGLALRSQLRADKRFLPSAAAASDAASRPFGGAQFEPGRSPSSSAKAPTRRCSRRTQQTAADRAAKAPAKTVRVERQLALDDRGHGHPDAAGAAASAVQPRRRGCARCARRSTRRTTRGCSTGRGAGRRGDPARRRRRRAAGRRHRSYNRPITTHRPHGAPTPNWWRCATRRQMLAPTTGCPIARSSSRWSRARCVPWP